LWGFGAAGKAALEEEDAAKGQQGCVERSGLLHVDARGCGYHALVGILSIFGTRVGHGLGVDSRHMPNNGRYLGPVGAFMLLPRALKSSGSKFNFNFRVEIQFQFQGRNSISISGSKFTDISQI
jgi:hypothetical protein